VDRITIDNPGDIHAQIILREISFRLSGGKTLVYDRVSGVLLRPPNTTSASRQFYDVMVNLHEGLFAGIVLR